MKFNVAPDARPQVKTLLIATLISIALWFIPFAEYLVYPIRLFVTFIHEGGHVLASLVTGSRIIGMTVSPDASGEVLAAVPQNLAAQFLVSSAGYLGATAFGVLLLLLIRKAIQARIVLLGAAIYVAVLTAVFGFLLPIWNIASGHVSAFGILFTVVSGLAISAGLIAVARFASQKAATFFLSFLAVQCVLNALFDLKTLFFISASLAPAHSDALNMANATGVPSLFWVLAWIGVSIVLVSIALRFYAVSRQRNLQQDLPFED